LDLGEKMYALVEMIKNESDIEKNVIKVELYDNIQEAEAEANRRESLSDTAIDKAFEFAKEEEIEIELVSYRTYQIIKVTNPSFNLDNVLGFDANNIIDFNKGMKKIYSKLEKNSKIKT